MSFVLHLPTATRRWLLHAASEALPQECCGLLVGYWQTDSAFVRQAIAATNVAADPLRQFEVDPMVLLATHRQCRVQGLSLLGSYHSHPTGLAQPSSRDVERALPDGALWLIVAGDQLRIWRSLGKPCGFEEGIIPPA